MNKILNINRPPVAKVVVINQAFIEPLFSGAKIAVMVQCDFIPGQQIIFETILNNKHVPVATATIDLVVGLRINPANESIHSRGQFSWIELDKNHVKQVIKHEGFDHPDDFWKTRTRLIEVNQAYFNNVKPIKNK